MVNTLIALARLVGSRGVLILELAGVALVIAGVAATWGTGAGLIAGGAAVLLKSLEIDLKRGGGG